MNGNGTHGLISIGDAFLQVVAEAPNAIAVQTCSDKVSYSELDRWSNSIAARLCETCRSSHTVLGLFGTDAPLLAGIVGTLRTNLTLVPVSSESPKQRIHDILELTGCKVVLCDDATYGLASELSAVTAIRVGDCRNDTCAKTVIASGNPDRAAICVFTSGSTGKPKGVLQSHRFLLHNAFAFQQLMELGVDDRHAMFVRYGHHAAMTTIVRQLVSGGCLLPMDSMNFTAKSLREQLCELEPTIVHSTPTVFRHLTANEFASVENIAAAFQHVRIVHLGGESVLQTDVERWRRYCPSDSRLLVVFGSSETGAVAFSLASAADYDVNLVDGLIPFPDKSVEIIPSSDDCDSEVGQVVVESRYLATKYLTDVAEPDEFQFRVVDAEVGLRQFRMGDWARRTRTNRIHLVGRRDEMVKIRGNRVELGEIESVLMSLPQVKEAAAVVKPHPVSSESTLIAFAVADDSELLEIRRQLESRLPTYMRPRLFLMRTLPKTQSGKVDKHALLTLPAALPDCERLESDDDPIDECTALLRSVWSQVLQESVPHKDPDFFDDAGGDSLNATSLAFQIRQRFALAVDVSWVYRNRTFSAQRAEIARSHPESRADAAVNTSTTTATQSQIGLYLRELVDSANRSITVSKCFHPKSTIRPELASRALRLLVERHAVLRTIIKPKPGGLELCVASMEEIDEPLVEQTTSPYSLGEISPTLIDMATAQFNFAKPPMIRIHIVECRNGEQLVLITAPHILVDGHSIQHVACELFEVLYAWTHGSRCELPTVRESFAEFAANQNAYQHTAECKRDAARLADQIRKHRSIVATQILSDPAEPMRTPGTYEEVLRTLDRPSMVTSEFAWYIACFTAAVSEFTGKDHILLAYPVALQRASFESPTIGMFTNFVPLSIRVDRSVSLTNHYQRVDRALKQSLQSSRIPIELVLRHLKKRAIDDVFDAVVNQIVDRKDPFELRGFRPFDFSNRTTNGNIPVLTVYDLGSQQRLKIESRFKATLDFQQLLCRIKVLHSQTTFDRPIDQMATRP